MLMSRDFFCRLTQPVQKIVFIYLFEFEEEKNLLTASKVPHCGQVKIEKIYLDKTSFCQRCGRVLRCDTLIQSYLTSKC